jgi:hypothetical protein
MFASKPKPTKEPKPERQDELPLEPLGPIQRQKQRRERNRG